ncbi:MAG: flavin monoamine oxidase family protein [Myxococcaceae bacterium]
MATTRRQFLAVLGSLAGAPAVEGALQALGLQSAHAPPPFTPVPTENARGRKVLVLGGGLAGMASAYELLKLGYDVTVLEAQDRPGGRCFSVRRGTRVTDVDGETQVCEFDAGQYYNCGPARIPGHAVTLDYCRELGVPVEVMVNRNPAAYVVTKKGPLAGRRLRQKEVEGDQDGYIAELLSKAVSAKKLDTELDEADRANLLDYLRSLGWLEKDRHYRGSFHTRGFASQPGAADEIGEVGAILSRTGVFGHDLGFRFFYAFDVNQAPAMMQVVGGTDGIAHAFARKLGKRLHLSSPVREIAQDGAGVRVRYGPPESLREARAEFAVCALPFTTLRNVTSDFPTEVKAAIAGVYYEAAGKIGLQFGRRFWEEDDRIYGGMSWTDQTITQIMYPSAGLLAPKGVLVGYYAYQKEAAALQAMRHAQRLETALTEGELLHPGYRKHLQSAFSVAWGKMPWLLGSWAEWGEDDAPRPAGYALLCRPMGRVHFAGDALSWNPGWMHGALASARHTVLAIHARASAERVPAQAH